MKKDKLKGKTVRKGRGFRAYRCNCERCEDGRRHSYLKNLRDVGRCECGTLLVDGDCPERNCKFEIE